MTKYRDAAERGDAEAQYQLGLCYVTSVDFEPMGVEAVKWLRKAAVQRHPESLFCLGMWHVRGIFSQDDALANAWYEYVAETGYVSARIFCGQ